MDFHQWKEMTTDQMLMDGVGVEGGVNTLCRETDGLQTVGHRHVFSSGPARSDEDVYFEIPELT